MRKLTKALQLIVVLIIGMGIGSGGFGSASAEETPVPTPTQAALRVMVRDLLDKYGYPPDFSNMAIETVVRQAESLTEEWLMERTSH